MRQSAHSPPRPLQRGTVRFHMSSQQKGLLPLSSNRHKPSPPNRHYMANPRIQILALDKSFQSVSNPSSLLVSQGKEPSLLSILLDTTFHTALKVRSGRPFLKPFPCATKLLSKLKRKPAYIARKYYNPPVMGTWGQLLQGSWWPTVDKCFPPEALVTE